MSSWLVLALVACSSAPEPEAPTPSTAEVITCPQCPEATCPEVTCPEVTCPACPKPPEPVARDWHCYDVHRPDGTDSGYCMPSARACEIQRGFSVKRRNGKTSACSTQEIAYCVLVSSPASMNREVFCARTPENCATRRQYLQQHPTLEGDEVSECVAMRNTDTYKIADNPLLPR